MKTTQLKEAIKSEIRKVLKEEYSEIDELARIAKTIKVADVEKAQEVINKFKDSKKKWIADMIIKVIESGDAGIAQVALAKAIGKVNEFGDGNQQSINPEVRSLTNAGIFTFGDTGTPTSTPTAPKTTTTPLATANDDEEEEINIEPEENDDADVDVKDDYEKIDDEDNIDDEEILIKKAAPSKELSTKASQLDIVVSDMKKIASDYKKAKESGNKEQELSLLDKLKEKNKEKVKLEKEVAQELGDRDDEE